MDILHQDVVTGIGAADKLAVTFASVKRRWRIREVERESVEPPAAVEVDERQIVKAVGAFFYTVFVGGINRRRNRSRVHGDRKNRAREHAVVACQVKSERVRIVKFGRLLSVQVRSPVCSGHPNLSAWQQERRKSISRDRHQTARRKRILIRVVDLRRGGGSSLGRLRA